MSNEELCLMKNYEEKYEDILLKISKIPWLFLRKNIWLTDF